ncbi:ATP-binding protein, partial [Pseudomonas syringae]
KHLYPDVAANPGHQFVETQLYAHAHGETLMIQRAISNLLSNAIRHGPAGSTVALELAESRTEALLAVRNTGEGIAAEHLPRIFDRFYRI